MSNQKATVDTDKKQDSGYSTQFLNKSITTYDNNTNKVLQETLKSSINNLSGLKESVQSNLASKFDIEKYDSIEKKLNKANNKSKLEDNDIDEENYDELESKSDLRIKNIKNTFQMLEVSTEHIVKIMKGNISLMFVYYNVSKMHECALIAYRISLSNTDKAELTQEWNKCNVTLNSLFYLNEQMYYTEYWIKLRDVGVVYLNNCKDVIRLVHNLLNDQQNNNSIETNSNTNTNTNSNSNSKAMFALVKKELSEVVFTIKTASNNVSMYTLLHEYVKNAYKFKEIPLLQHYLFFIFNESTYITKYILSSQSVLSKYNQQYINFVQEYTSSDRYYFAKLRSMYTKEVAVSKIAFLLKDDLELKQPFNTLIQSIENSLNTYELKYMNHTFESASDNDVPYFSLKMARLFRSFGKFMSSMDTDFFEDFVYAFLDLLELIQDKPYFQENFNEFQGPMHEVIKYFLKLRKDNYFELFGEDQNILKFLTETGLVEDPVCKDATCVNCSKRNMHLCMDYCSHYKATDHIYRNCISRGQYDDINVNFVKLNVNTTADSRLSKDKCNKINNAECLANNNYKNKTIKGDLNSADYFNINSLDLDFNINQSNFKTPQSQDLENAKESELSHQQQFYRFKSQSTLSKKSQNPENTERMNNLIDNLHNNQATLLNLENDKIHTKLDLSTKYQSTIESRSVIMQSAYMLTLYNKIDLIYIGLDLVFNLEGPSSKLLEGAVGMQFSSNDKVLDQYKKLRQMDSIKSTLTQTVEDLNSNLFDGNLTLLNNEIGKLTTQSKKLNADINLGYDLIQNLDSYTPDKLEFIRRELHNFSADSDSPGNPEYVQNSSENRDSKSSASSLSNSFDYGQTQDLDNFDELLMNLTDSLYQVYETYSRLNYQLTLLQQYVPSQTLLQYSYKQIMLNSHNLLATLHTKIDGLLNYFTFKLHSSGIFEDYIRLLSRWKKNKLIDSKKYIYTKYQDFEAEFDYILRELNRIDNHDVQEHNYNDHYNEDKEYK